MSDSEERVDGATGHPPVPRGWAMLEADDVSSVERRDWRRPRDPAALAGLLRSFAGMLDGMPGQAAMVSSCPAWFDDISFETREAAVLDGHCVTTDGYWYDPVEPRMDNPAGTGPAAREGMSPADAMAALMADWTPMTSTPEFRHTRRHMRIEKALDGVPADDAHAIRGLLEAVYEGNPLGRENVEAAVHPLESEEVAAFCRLPTVGGDRPYLFISHTNGDTDVAYGLDAAGRLAVWPALSTNDRVKEDTIPVQPDPGAALPV